VKREQAGSRISSLIRKEMSFSNRKNWCHANEPYEIRRPIDKQQ
jgi:hypothetical protein